MAASNPAAPNANDRFLGWYAAREPLVVLVLSLGAVAFFFLVRGLSGVYQREFEDRGNLWWNRGRTDLRAGHLEQAVNDFQEALYYAKDNYAYELGLAQALVALNRTEQARTYLINLWQRKPENGSVNLQLARIFASKGDRTQALRYYHNAIYAVWGENAEAPQLSARLELIQFLLQEKASNRAESELIAIGRNVPDDASVQLEIGDLFMRVPDWGRALALYQQVLRREHRNPDGLAGAGRAAFELGQYETAERYLTTALAERPNDAQLADLLKMAKTIPNMDPDHFFSTAKRDRIVQNDLAIAGERLKTCLNGLPEPEASHSPLQSLSRQWMDMKTRLTERGFRQHPEWTDPAMNLVFAVERETSNVCGSPNGDDLLLLLLAKRHGES